MYTIDPETQDIVITGFEQGIGASPYSGLTDSKSVNISSVPGEAAVNFSTQSVTPPQILNANVTSSSGTNPSFISFTGAVGLENGMAITFSSMTGLTGATTATPYWVGNCSNVAGTGTCTLSASFAQSSNLVITATGTGVFSTYNMGTPKFFARAKGTSPNAVSGFVYYMVDSSGYVWTNHLTTTSGYWEFTGNTNLTGAAGEGLVYYEVTDGTTVTGYLFVFRLAVIDYLQTTAASNALTWTYGWNPNNGLTGQSGGLDITYDGHTAIVPPDNRVYFCNGSNVFKFFQTASGTIFNPTDTSTYTHTNYNLLPINDKAISLAPLGTNVLIGGIQNVVYSWDTTSNLISVPILLPETFVSQLVTVNTNTYVFAGNRGNIYITNGSQANHFAKVPDHLSGTVSPYFQWMGAAYQKNKLYFGFLATDNANTALGGYSGLWELNLVTKAMCLSNQISLGSYTVGYVSAIQAIPATFGNTQPAGTGLFIGWNNGTNSYGGIDKTISTPYTGGQSYVISDMIPIGTLLKLKTPIQVEFKLSTPLLTNETVELQVAPYLGSNFNSLGTTSGTTSSVILSGNWPFSIGTLPTLQGQQWLLVKAILTGKSSSPSYNRLTQIRVIQK